MPASACCSAITSGVAIRSVDLHSNHAVLDEHRKGVDGHVRRQVQGLSGAQVEPRPVPRTFDHAVLFIQLAVHELAVVMGAAILDGEDLSTAVDDADLEVLEFHEALGSRGELFERADVDQGTHWGNTDSRGRDSSLRRMLALTARSRAAPPPGRGVRFAACQGDRSWA